MALRLGGGKGGAAHLLSRSSIVLGSGWPSVSGTKTGMMEAARGTAP